MANVDYFRGQVKAVRDTARQVFHRHSNQMPHVVGILDTYEWYWRKTTGRKLIAIQAELARHPLGGNRSELSRELPIGNSNQYLTRI